MPRFQIQAPDGRTVTVEGDSPPSQAAAGEIFAKLPKMPSADGAPSADASSAPAAPAEDANPLANSPLGQLTARARELAKKPFTEAVKEEWHGLLDSFKDLKPENVAAMGVRAGSTAAGQTLGSAGGMPGRIAGGAIGSVVGEIAGDLTEGRAITPGGLARAAITGAVPGRNLAGATEREVAREGAKYAVTNVAGEEAASLLDQGRLANAGDTASAATMGFAGAKAASASAKPQPAPVSPQDALNAGRINSFSDVRPWGVKIAPTQLDKGSNIVASVANPVATERAVAKNNIFAFQRKARADVGLSEEAIPTTRKELEDVRAKAAEPYKTIQSIYEDANEKLTDIRKQYSDPQELAAALDTPEAKKYAIQASADVEGLKVAREDSQRYLDAMRRGDPEAYGKWQEAKSRASALENNIDAAAMLEGDTGLAKRLKASRELYAKSYALQGAITSKSAGLIDPADLGAQLNNDVPLTGNLLKIANFANDFDRAAVESSAIRPPNASTIRVLGATQNAARGNVAGLVGGAVDMFAGRPARAMLLSDMIQDGMLKPSERQNFSSAFARYLAEEAQRK